MKHYKLPSSWVREICTCGCYPTESQRFQLWEDWNDAQKESATQPFKEVLKKLEEWYELYLYHMESIDGELYDDFKWMNLSRVGIDASKHYTPSQMISIIENAMKEESKRYADEVAELTGYVDMADLY